MNQQLREKRDRAFRRHEDALNNFPARDGDIFHKELQTVIKELEAVVKTADKPDSDPVEVAKAYRWLGDAYYDFGLGKDESALTRSSLAYQRSEELLSSSQAPLEKAKLDFNFGNTLRGLSKGFDVALMEAAQLRYEEAIRTFRKHNLPDFVATIEEQLQALDPQLRLARKFSSMKQDSKKLMELQKRLVGAKPLERDQIAKELKNITNLTLIL
jgi:hypothetical protein